MKQAWFPTREIGHPDRTSDRCRSASRPPAATWSGDSIVFSAAARDGLHLWRQRLSLITLNAYGAPELLTPGVEWTVFPTVAQPTYACVSRLTIRLQWPDG